MNVKITIDEAQFKKEVVAALIPELNKYLAERIKGFRSKLRALLSVDLWDSPEIDSLLGGELQAELGVEDTQQRLAAIIDQWAANIDVDFSPAKYAGGRIFSKVIISAIRNDYSDVLSLDESRYSTRNGSTIEWLEWILLQGDRQIIRDYDIGMDFNNYSRTGLGKIMIGGKGKSWGVPPQFAGTSKDNFITRTLDRLDVKIAVLFENEFTK